MLKHLVVAAAVMGALALPVPAAAAGHHAADCLFESVQQEDVTGPSYEGVAYGYVIGDADDAVTVYCAIKVNGATASVTPTGTGTAVAYSAGRISFVAADTDEVAVCAVTSVDGTPYERCRMPEPVQVPPEEVYRLIHELLDWPPWPPWSPDPSICYLLQGLAGTYGPVSITEQGDVYVVGEPQWDCPPYDIWPTV